MKDLKYEATQNSINNLLKVCAEHGIDVEEFQLVLNDAYIIYNDGLLSVHSGGRRPSGRRYILIVPEYRNEWSDALYILCTDSEKLVERYRMQWQAAE